MSEAPTPPKPPNPVDAAKHAGKGLKGKLTGHPKWVYIAGATVLIGVAFIIWQRSRSNPGGAPQADNTAEPVTDPFFPDQTQGAFGGFGDPQSLDPLPGLDPVTPDPTGGQAVDPNPIIINVGSPAPTPPDPVAPASVVPAMPTGGGTHPARHPAQHATPPAYTATLSPHALASVPPPGMGTATACPKDFPDKGPDGCFRREYDPHRKKHYHQYADGHKVWL